MPEVPTFPPAPRRGVPPWPVVVGVSVLGGALGAFGLLWFFPGLRRAEIPPGTQTVIVEKPGQVVVEESTRVRELRQVAQRSVAGLYRRGRPGAPPSAPAFPEQSPLGQAVVVTADGWFSTVARTGLAAGDLFVVEHEAYVVERLLKDPASPILLGKVSATQLIPTRFTEAPTVYPGMTVFALTAEGDTLKSSLQAAATPLPKDRLVLSSDTLSTALLLGPDGSLSDGTPVFALDGTLLGLVEAAGDDPRVIPVTVLASLLTSVLETGAATRPTLGLEYVFEPSVGSTKAAARIRELRLPSGPGRSPAAGALRVDDRVLEVGGEAVTDPGSLFATIQRYRPGADVTVRYLRDGREDQTVIKLGSLVTTP